ncbi:hypothetical protein TNCT_401071 [Trichonephila clavata]|uniref:Uncharacterized protein n=1 Tax=Trichonephila clavata TaxID=2740835 RepID=A0A8X6FUI0_TRICU|nr:hypothetical protein TNCT_401071 [Trichonephila clavata]
MNVHQIGSCFGVHVQAINFVFVPPPYTRVASVGVASFAWVNVLYLIKKREFSEQQNGDLILTKKAEKD